MTKETIKVSSLWILGFKVLEPLRIYGDYSGGVHLFPFRTEKLSPPALMVLPSPVEE